MISAHRLAAENGWPAQLMAPAFEPLRNTYMAMVEEARNRPEGEEIPDAKIVEAINVIEQMRDLAKQRPDRPGLRRRRALPEGPCRPPADGPPA